MKNLMIISFLLLGSCAVSLDTPENVSRHSFPVEWQGYYTRVSGDYDLPKEFKVSDKYMSFQDKYYNDSDDFTVYQIATIEENNSSKFSFYPENSYDDTDGGFSEYTFEETTTLNQITVKRTTFFGLSFITAIYTKKPLSS